MRAADGQAVRAEADEKAHVNSTARMGNDPQSPVARPDCRRWDGANLSVLTKVGGVNPSPRIRAMASRMARSIRASAKSVAPSSRAPAFGARGGLYSVVLAPLGNLRMRGEPAAPARLDVLDQPLQHRHARAVAGDVRVHRQQE